MQMLLCYFLYEKSHSVTVEVIRDEVNIWTNNVTRYDQLKVCTLLITKPLEFINISKYSLSMFPIISN